MGRKRSYDEAAVVVQAARTFVASGYEATSLDMLVAATGLHRGSLYGAFGSKRGLFIETLRSPDDGRLSAVERLDLLLVALLELAPSDRAIRDLAERQIEALPSPATVHLGKRLLERAGVITPNEPTREVIT
jgi:TetR/AcrR family transcriptional repressor of nem operon